MLISETQYMCKGSFIMFSLAKFLIANFLQPVPECFFFFVHACTTLKENSWLTELHLTPLSTSV